MPWKLSHNYIQITLADRFHYQSKKQNLKQLHEDDTIAGIIPPTYQISMETDNTIIYLDPYPVSY